MKSRLTEIKWALIFVAVTLLWMVMEKALGWHDEHIDKHAFYTNFFAIPAVVVYFFALFDKRKRDYQGKMTYVEGLVSGLIITLIVALLSPVSQYITSTYITPDYFENVTRYVIENEEMSREEAENYFTLTNYIRQSVVGALLMGILTSLVVAIFAKKTR